MVERMLGWLKDKENKACCGVTSRRGVYRMRRMGRIFSEMGEVVDLYMWSPLCDTNVGLGVGNKGHVDCKNEGEVD